MHIWYQTLLSLPRLQSYLRNKTDEGKEIIRVVDAVHAAHRPLKAGTNISSDDRVDSVAVSLFEGQDCLACYAWACCLFGALYSARIRCGIEIGQVIV